MVSKSTWVLHLKRNDSLMQWFICLVCGPLQYSILFWEKYPEVKRSRNYNFILFPIFVYNYTGWTVCQLIIPWPECYTNSWVKEPYLSINFMNNWNWWRIIVTKAKHLVPRAGWGLESLTQSLVLQASVLHLLFCARSPDSFFFLDKGIIVESECIFILLSSNQIHLELYKYFININEDITMVKFR